jgi:integrase
MKRYRLVYRGIRDAYYSLDTQTKKRESLGTNNADEAQRLIDTKNEAVQHTEMNLQIAQVYLQHSDPALAARTWQDVMKKIISLKTGSTRERWENAIKDIAFDLIRHRRLLQTSAEHFLAVLNAGTVATNVFLRCAHNFAIGMHWLPWPVLPKLQWPAIHYKDKRAITLAEHEKIIRRERNPELNAFYELLWHLGAAQSDLASLTAENVNWTERMVAFRRHKTEVAVVSSVVAKVFGVSDSGNCRRCASLVLIASAPSSANGRSVRGVRVSGVRGAARPADRAGERHREHDESKIIPKNFLLLHQVSIKKFSDVKKLTFRCKNIKLTRGKSV